MARIALFEDPSAELLTPIALMRPAFELVCGQCSQRERLEKQGLLNDWGVFLRKYLVETYREAQPSAKVNDFVWLAQEQTLVLNGRWLTEADSLEKLGENEVGMIGETIVALTLHPEEAPLLTEENWLEMLTQLAASRTAVQVGGTLINYPWNLIDQNGQQLRNDFAQFLTPSIPENLPQAVEILGPVENVFIDPTVEFDPFVVMDARQGPISIEAGAKVQAFTRIEGPCHVGEGAQLFRALVRENTTIGPVCRVGGEVEDSILHGFVNKYHEGFLGHSYVCPWVNLGALSTSSDLKNDYSEVKVPVGGQMTLTGSTKVGCFIGDHTKTALGSLFNTGSSIGIMCIVLPGGELLPKYVPSFSRVWHGELTDGWEMERYLETAHTAMGRRGEKLTDATERLMRYLAKHTQSRRGKAIARYQEKQEAKSQESLTIHWK